jgi:hypothetical protein
MNTDELIAALGTDAGANPPRSFGREWGLIVAAGVLGAIALFILTLRVRPDFSAAIAEPRVLLKFAATLALAIPAVLLTFGLARPGAPRANLALLSIAPALVLLAAAIEMFVTPSSGWAPRAMGAYPTYCVTLVPMLSIAPLAGILFALSRGAATRPGLAGFVGGLAAGGIGAAIYALHCTDDSPLFVMVWYSLAIAFVSAVGALLGSRLLRW